MSEIFEKDEGQAMVELVIILIFIMAMCAGMIASIRLLGFQFWAQQEARYLAFEQTWAAHDYYADSVGEPLLKLQDSSYFGRPSRVTNRRTEKAIESDGGLTELLSKFNKTQDSPALMLAKHSNWWTESSADWLEIGKSIGNNFKSVPEAWARESIRGKAGELQTKDKERIEFEPASLGEAFNDRVFPKIKSFLNKAEVGPRVCRSIRGVINGSAVLGDLAVENCPARVEKGLASALSSKQVFESAFNTYEEQLQIGKTESESLEIAIRAEIASGFYSFFDNLVESNRQQSGIELLSGRVETSVALLDSSVTKLVSNARYIGSAAAVAAILAEASEISTRDVSNRSWESELNLETAVNEILHIDAEEVVPGGGAYFLSPVYLPVPSTFGPVAGGLQDAVMKNLLMQPEDSDLVEEQMDNANKFIEVSYNSEGGMFNLATKNIKGSNSAELKAKFYLVTQPWHLTRRVNGTGDYRQKGTQIDSAGEETEEAVMRRRVLGLWLVPSDPAAFAEPISLIPGLGFLTPAFQSLEPIGEVVSTVKRFITDNPVFKAANALGSLPGVEDIIPVPPVWPAVRPDAYPGSQEMTGNDPNQPDRLMNGDRQFKDYVEEQRENNPKP